jgi:hypothetical protein
MSCQKYVLREPLGIDGSASVNRELKQIWHVDLTKMTQYLALAARI